MFAGGGRTGRRRFMLKSEAAKCSPCVYCGK